MYEKTESPAEVVIGFHLQASLLTKEICRNVEAAAKAVKGIDFTIVLRGDSTLRGHFPEVILVLYLCM